MTSILLPLISYQELIAEPIKRQIIDLIDTDSNYINSAGNKLTNSDGISLLNAEESTVTIGERDWDRSGLSNNITHNNGRYKIIDDPTIGLSVRLADIEKEFTININKRFATLGDAVWWRNSIMGNIRDVTSNTTASLSISPCIPNKILSLIEECRLRKVTREREDRSFMEYLLGISIDTISIDTNSTKTTAAVMFPEVLRNVVFSLPTEPPEATYDEGMYTIELSITTILKVPSSVVVKYKPFVGGILMPKDMVDTDVDVNTDSIYESKGNVLDSLLTFKGADRSDYRKYCYQLPAFEAYRFPTSNWNVSPIFQSRVTGDLSSPRTIINIRDLFGGAIQGYELDPELLRYIETFPNLVTNTNESAVNILLIKNGIPVTQNKLTVDADLNLVTDYDLDMLGDYHLVITTALQTAAIPQKAFGTLRDFPVLTNRLIKHTNPGIDYSELPNTSIVTTAIYRRIFDKILNLGNIIGPITANTLVVHTGGYIK